MKNYSDAYLLSKPYQFVASGWDSAVFIDEENPDVILKLYDTLTREQVLEYYQMHERLSHVPLHERDGIQLEVLNPLKTHNFQIIDTEDGVLVVLPRVDGIPLSKYGDKDMRTKVYTKVKTLMEESGIPTKNGFEVKLENLMVSSTPESIHIVITDIGSRIDECLVEASSMTTLQ